MVLIYILIKVWPNLADLVIGLLIFWFLIKKNSKQLSAAIWSLIFLLNPISIIVSSAHGQIDSVPTLLVIITILILQFKYSKIYLLISAIFLGLSISIKPNPLILVPAFLIFLHKKTSFWEKSVFLFAIFIPVVILFLPFLQNKPQYILEKDKMIILYTITGLLAMMGFYMYFNPAILLIQFSSIQTYLPQYMQIYSFDNLFFWLTLFLWLLILIKKNSLRYG